MDADRQDFDTLLKEAAGLRKPTPWIENRVRTYRMCAGNFSAMAIQEMLGCKTRRTLLRFARKIDDGDLAGALCHGNFGKLKREYRGAFHYLYKAIFIQNRKANSGVLRQEILETIGGPLPSSRTLCRWLAQCRFMRKQLPRIQAAHARQAPQAAPAVIERASPVLSSPTTQQ
jgi:hypothetical protein